MNLFEGLKNSTEISPGSIRLLDTNISSPLQNEEYQNYNCDSGSRNTKCYNFNQGKNVFIDLPDHIKDQHFDINSDSAEEANNSLINKILDLDDASDIVVNENNWELIVQPPKPNLYARLKHMILQHTKPSIQIRVGLLAFNCHMLVLQCYSEFFMECQNEVYIELPDEKITPKTFMMVYNWMLEDQPLIKRKGILSLYQAATFLRIPDLVNQCWLCIDNDVHFREKEAFILYMEARRYDLAPLENMMLIRICKYFLTLVSSQDFLDLSANEVCTLLQSNAIGVNSEIEIFLSAIRWLYADWEDRQNYIANVMQCVRFSLMPAWYLVTLGHSNQCQQIVDIVTDPHVMFCINKAVSYTTTLESRAMNREEFIDFLDQFQLSVPVQRQWVFDKQCQYHHHIQCHNTKYLTYGIFLKYLNLLRSSDEDYWKTLEYASFAPFDEGTFCGNKQCNRLIDPKALLGGSRRLCTAVETIKAPEFEIKVKKTNNELEDIDKDSLSKINSQLVFELDNNALEEQEMQLNITETPRGHEIKTSPEEKINTYRDNRHNKFVKIRDSHTERQPRKEMKFMSNDLETIERKHHGIDNKNIEMGDYVKRYDSSDDENRICKQQRQHYKRNDHDEARRHKKQYDHHRSRKSRSPPYHSQKYNARSKEYRQRSDSIVEEDTLSTDTYYKKSMKMNRSARKGHIIYAEKEVCVVSTTPRMTDFEAKSSESKSSTDDWRPRKEPEYGRCQSRDSSNCDRSPIKSILQNPIDRTGQSSRSICCQKSYSPREYNIKNVEFKNEKELSLRLGGDKMKSARFTVDRQPKRNCKVQNRRRSSSSDSGSSRVSYSGGDSCSDSCSSSDRNNYKRSSSSDNNENNRQSKHNESLSRMPRLRSEFTNYRTNNYLQKLREASIDRDRKKMRQLERLMVTEIKTNEADDSDDKNEQILQRNQEIRLRAKSVNIDPKNIREMERLLAADRQFIKEDVNRLRSARISVDERHGKKNGTHDTLNQQYGYTAKSQNVDQRKLKEMKRISNGKTGLIKVNTYENDNVKKKSMKKEKNKVKSIKARFSIRKKQPVKLRRLGPKHAEIKPFYTNLELKNEKIFIFGGIDPSFQPWSTQIQTNKTNDDNDNDVEPERISYGDQVLCFDQSAMNWKELSSIPYGSRHHHSAVHCNGLIYIIGGTRLMVGTTKSIFEKTVWSYDPIKNAWKRECSLPEPRRDFAVISIENKCRECKGSVQSHCGNVGFYVIGGEGVHGPLNSVLFYDVIRHTWIKKPSLNYGRHGFTATIVNNEIWIAGGVVHHTNAELEKSNIPINNYISDTMEYCSLLCTCQKSDQHVCKNQQDVQGLNRASNRFICTCERWKISKFHLRKPILYGKFCQTNDRNLYLIGGISVTPSKQTFSTDEIDIFDFETLNWHLYGHLKYARHGHDAIAIKDKIMIVGGMSSNKRMAFKEVEIFDTKQIKSFDNFPSLPLRVSGCALISLSDS